MLMKIWFGVTKEMGKKGVTMMMGKKNNKKKKGQLGGPSNVPPPDSPASDAPETGKETASESPSIGTDPSKAQESENTATPSNEGQKQDEGPKLDEILFKTVPIKLQNGESIELQLGPGDTVTEVRQLLQYAPESCFFTCYDLFLLNENNESWNLEYCHVDDISCGEYRLEMVAVPYDERSITTHVDRTRDLLSRSSLHSSVSSSLARNHDTRESTSSNLEDPAKLVVTDIDKMSFLVDPSKSPPMLFSPLNQEIECVESIELSSFNPPPKDRSLEGDLVYLDVVPLEGNKYCITGTEKGFYINTSGGKVLDPRPRKSVPEATTLVELLQNLSSKFKKAFGELLQRRASAHPFENVHSSLPPNSWLGEYPVPDHKRNVARMETALPHLLYGTEPIGVHRDWNEEVQICRVMPHEAHNERILRDGALNKFTTEFVDAAINGAVGVISRSIRPLNPSEPDHLHMYVHNNIFFSYAFDTDVEDFFRTHESVSFAGDVQQDVNDLATYASANNELIGTKAYQEADVSGLYILASCIVDYRGHRLVAQTILPGFIGSNINAPLLYGSMDNGNTYSWDEAFHGKVLEAAKHLHLKQHSVFDGSNLPFFLAAPATCRGIVGRDGRPYIFDFGRGATPRDANYKEPSSIFHILRPELITAFCESEQGPLPKGPSKSEKDPGKSVLSDSEDQSVEVHCESEQGPLLEGRSKSEKDADETVLPDTVSENKHPTERCIRLHPNVFAEVRLADDRAVVAKDEEDVTHASNYITDMAIPTFISDLSSFEVTPVDGQTLTDALHQRGINVRYIAKVEEGVRSIPHLQKLCLNEIIVRSAKHLLKDLLRETESRERGPAISHFLNCLFGYVADKADAPDSKIQKKGMMKRGASSRKNQSSYLSFTTKNLWTAIWGFAQLKYKFVVTTTDSRLQGKKIPVLRNLCKKVGIVITARVYDLEANEPFKASDILDLRAVVKHALPINSEAIYLVEQGKVQFAQAKISKALESFKEALSIFEQVAGPINKEVANCCRHLAMILRHSGDIKGAIRHLRNELIINERCLGLDHPDTAHSYCNLGQYYHHSGKTELGIRHMEHGLLLLTLSSGPDHPDVAETLINIGNMYQDLGNIDQALLFFHKALAKTTALLGEEHYRTAVCYHVLAVLYNAMERYKLAVKNEEHTKTILVRLHGEDHPKTRDSEKWRFIFSTRADEADARESRKQSAQALPQVPAQATPAEAPPAEAPPAEAPPAEAPPAEAGEDTNE